MSLKKYYVFKKDMFFCYYVFKKYYVFTKDMFFCYYVFKKPLLCL